MPSRLTKMRLRFVSLVDRGAGEAAEVVLAKRDTTCPECGADMGSSSTCPSCGYDAVKKDDPTSGDSHVPVPMGDTGKAKKRPGSVKDPRKKLLVDGQQDPEDAADGGDDEGSEGEPSADNKKPVQKNNHGPDGAGTLPPVRTATEESMGDKIEKGDIDFSELPAEVLEYIEKVEDRVVDLEGEVEDLSKRAPVAKADDEGGDEPEDIFKGASPAVREHFAKMQADLDAATAIAKAEQSARLDREFLAKAETLSGLAAPAKDVAEVLKSVHALDADLATKVEGLLATASTAVTESALFTEVGKRSVGASQTSGKLDEIAKSFQAADSTLTKEQAVAKALDDNPALYSEYLAEMEA